MIGASVDISISLTRYGTVPEQSRVIMFASGVQGIPSPRHREAGPEREKQNVVSA